MNLGDLVGSWGLPPNTREEFKTLLSDHGRDRACAPDQAFWDLTTKDLASAGVAQRRTQIMLKRQVQQGRKEGKSFCADSNCRLVRL